MTTATDHKGLISLGQPESLRVSVRGLFSGRMRDVR